MPGKIFTGPIAATFLSPYEHLAHKSSWLLSPAVACAQGLALNSQESAWTFTVWKLSHSSPLHSSVAWPLGCTGVRTACFQCVRTDQSCPGWAARLWDGRGEAGSPHLPSIPPCGTRTLAAQMLLLCSPCLTKWFLPPTARWSLSCFLLRERNQTEEHWCHKYLRKDSHPG